MVADRIAAANAAQHVEIARWRAGALTSFGMRSELAGIQGPVVAAAEPYRLRRCAPLDLHRGYPLVLMDRTRALHSVSLIKRNSDLA